MTLCHTISSGNYPAATEVPAAEKSADVWQVGIVGGEINEYLPYSVFGLFQDFISRVSSSRSSRLYL